ncbi:MAG: NFACT RNA binding domain-containing protein [Candidatus Marinimicrobia bacterium]|nr:NFACT RNA binding domain-containing protein [Candidatus Neomarinimicrobiota bacterium]
MITNWFTLQKCTDYFDQEYRNKVLERCFTFEKNELWLQFRDLPSLKVHLGQPFQYILRSSSPLNIKKESVRIFPALEGAILEAVAMLPGERVMRFIFKDGSVLSILFLSNRGNVVYEKSDSLKYFKKKITIDKELLIEKEVQTFSSLREDPRFSPFWKKNGPEIFGINDYNSIIEIIRSSNGKEFHDRFVLSKTDTVFQPEEFYSNYRQFVITHLQKGQFHQDHKSIEARFSAKLNDLQRKLQDTEDTDKNRDRADRYRFFADTLSACRHLVQAHSDTFQVPEMHQQDKFPNEISLKKDIPIAENIDQFYKKARSSENRIEENKKRHQQLLREYDEWEKYYNDFQKIKDARALRDWKKAHPDVLKEANKNHTGDNERRPYKEFIKDDWRIWIGRSARDNDEMTFKHATKTDIWLHTRHSTGSHVIIKKDGKKDIPKHIIEFAASLAARHSDEKHSSLVTVTYTQRKYVTKRKGMPPGKVHFQYEKDVMVKPADI